MLSPSGYGEIVTAASRILFGSVTVLLEACDRAKNAGYKRGMTEKPADESANAVQSCNITAPQDAAGARLDKWLSEAVDGLSRSRARALVETGAVRVNAAVLTDPRAKVIAGALYDLTLPALEPATPKPEAIPLDILFEDAHLLIVNKAAGMAVHPAVGNWSGTLVNALLAHCGDTLPGINGIQRPGIVHRLDKGTSGVMVVAKSEVAHLGLTSTFQAHDIERAYLAITRGAPRPAAGTIDEKIARAEGDRKKMGVPRNPDHPSARRAITHYRTLEVHGTRTKGTGIAASALIECRLETGRTHQIRVHMSHIGCALVGDPVYGRHRGITAVGGGPAFDLAMETARSFSRQALHAAVLGFNHPVTGKDMRFEAPPPEDFESLLNSLQAMPGDRASR